MKVSNGSRRQAACCSANPASLLDCAGRARHMQETIGIDMSEIKAICVYCGAGPGTNPAFIKAARQLGQILAENGIRLVYGGGPAGPRGGCAARGPRLRGG